VNAPMVLSRDAARALTDEVKADAAALWSKLLRLYEGGAHTALGYSSWHAYCSVEFDLGRDAAYRTLKAAEVVEVLKQSPNGDSRPQPATEAVARELAPVIRLHGPEVAAEVWDVLTEDGRQPTAAQTRDVVQALPKDKSADTPVRDYVAEALARKPQTDLTFMAISNAIERLRDVDPDSMWLPPDRGNIDALDRDFVDLMDWLSRFAVVWASHKHATEEAA
jgi:hypothetical protein